MYITKKDLTLRIHNISAASPVKVKIENRCKFNKQYFAIGKRNLTFI